MLVVLRLIIKMFKEIGTHYCYVGRTGLPSFNCILEKPVHPPGVFLSLFKVISITWSVDTFENLRSIKIHT